MQTYDCIRYTFSVQVIVILHLALVYQNSYVGVYLSIYCGVPERFIWPDLVVVVGRHVHKLILQRKSTTDISLAASPYFYPSRG